MRIGIMQPYFFPYIGYWQLIKAVDKFVVYDNIQFTKKSWIRRNRILLNEKDKLFTLPIRNDSDFLDVRERYLSETFSTESRKLLKLIKTAYKNAPQFEKVFPLIERCVNFENDNLFAFIYHSILCVVRYLNIKTDMIISSSISMDHSLHNKYRVIEICKNLGGNEYVNPIGGVELYNKGEFLINGVDLKFIKTNKIEYKQFGNVFISNLSIMDVMMFNEPKKINEMLDSYELL